MTKEELEFELSAMGIERNSKSEDDYKKAREYITFNDLDIDYIESCGIVRRYVRGTLFTQNEMEEIMEDCGIQRFLKTKWNWLSFKRFTDVLNYFKKNKEEWETYQKWAIEYIKRPFTAEEQGKLERGEIRIEDI